MASTMSFHGKDSDDDGNGDLISELPAPIIHDILARLSSKDSARACVLSKTWRNLYDSRHTMVFNEYDFFGVVSSSNLYDSRYAMIFNKYDIYGGEYSSFTRWSYYASECSFNRWRMRVMFMKYVERSLEQKSLPLQKFQLIFAQCDNVDVKFGRINTWLKDLFDRGVKTMILHVPTHWLCRDRHCPLDLVSMSLHELYLNGLCLMEACRDINLPNLKVLCLSDRDLSADLVKHLISGCPQVEDLRFRLCTTLKNLNVSSLARLVKLSFFFCGNVRIVETGSPVFQSLTYCGGYYSSSPITLLGGASESVRKLYLNSLTMRNWWHANELSSFKCLEELILLHVRVTGNSAKLRISSQSLRRLVIKNCGGTTEVVEIDCPNLLSLVYERNDIPFRFVSAPNLRDLKLIFLPEREHSTWL